MTNKTIVSNDVSDLKGKDKEIYNTLNKEFGNKTYELNSGFNVKYLDLHRSKDGFYHLVRKFCYEDTVLQSDKLDLKTRQGRISSKAIKRISKLAKFDDTDGLIKEAIDKFIMLDSKLESKLYDRSKELGAFDKSTVSNTVVSAYTNANKKYNIEEGAGLEFTLIESGNLVKYKLALIDIIQNNEPVDFKLVYYKDGAEGKDFIYKIYSGGVSGFGCNIRYNGSILPEDSTVKIITRDPIKAVKEYTKRLQEK